MYGKNELIDPDVLTTYNEDSLSDEIVDFKSMLEAVIQEQPALDTILQGSENERIAISDFIIRTTVDEVEEFFKTLPLRIQEKYLYDEGRDDFEGS